MRKKYFIVTVDTEGDNLWNYRMGDAITTENGIKIDCTVTPGLDLSDMKGE